DSPLFVGNSDVTPPAAEESQAVAPAQPVHVSTENYLAHARRAARPIAEADGDRFSMRSQIHVPDGARSDQHRRTARALAAGFLVVLLLAAGAMLTRNSQSRASALTPNSTNLIALDVPKSGIGEASATTAAPSIFPAPQQPADTNAPAANAATSRIAAASVFAFGDAGTSSLAQLMARANTGDAMAEMSLGLKYADGDGVPANETEAAFWLQKAAEAGQAVAQYRLGTLYERGRGVPTDAHQALRWYGEAASHGNRRAMHNLAVVYADGTGTEKNFQEAARWFKDAAELGLTDSQFNLAVLYERGLGVKESLAEAYKWYAIAAASGDAESKARLEALTNQITPADRKAADDAAKAYKPRPIDIAANNG
ncbi:MAG TPA: tetratricopeptide repeat protein, partial [Micropepsaceae bacterium]|nr:tetratricopeptide repeat protein [Micropepsaceae bacterium]